MERWILTDSEMLDALLAQIILRVISLGRDPNVLVFWHGAEWPNAERTDEWHPETARISN